MTFLPIYKDVYNLHLNKYRYYIYKGGRGSGKSHHIALALLSQALHREVRILCTREIQNSIKDSVHKLFRDYINKYKLKGFTITDNNIKHKSGSEFIFKGLNDINDSSSQSIKSLEGVDIAWIEEAQTISKRSLDVLIPTIRKEKSCMIFSYNPLTNNDPIKVELVDNPRPNTFIKHVDYIDNPFLDKAQIEEAEFCKEHKPEDYEHIWLGQPQNFASNTVTKYFTDDNIKDINYCPDLPIHICCDFNVDPMCWVLAHKSENKIYFFDEIVIENTTTSAAIEEFCTRYPHHYGDIIINGDASGDNRSVNSEYTNYVIIKNRLQQAGYKPIINIKPFNPPIKNRIAAWNAKILNNKGVRGVIVAPKCKWLKYNIENLKYKEGTSLIDLPTHHQIKSDRNNKFLGHIFDAASYPVEYYWPVTPEYLPPDRRPQTDLERFKSKQ